MSLRALRAECYAIEARAKQHLHLPQVQVSPPSFEDCSPALEACASAQGASVGRGALSKIPRRRGATPSQ